MLVNKETMHVKGIPSRLWSPNLWTGFPLDLPFDTTKGVYYHDEFKDFVGDVPGGTNKAGQYALYGDTGVDLHRYAGNGTAGTTQDTWGVDGGAEITANDADNDEAVITGPGPEVVVESSATVFRKIWFEARVQKASIANNALAMFLGLGFDNGSPGNLAKTLALTDDAGDLGAFSYLGFHVDQAAGSTVDFVYKAEGGAQTVAIAGAKTMVADTWTKFGFVYDRDALATERIRVFVDDVENSTKVTQANIAAATFPDGEALTRLFVAKVGAATAVPSRLGWWTLAGLFV